MQVPKVVRHFVNCKSEREEKRDRDLQGVRSLVLQE